MPRLPPEELPYRIWKLRTRHIFIAINETASKNILRKISNENGQRLQGTAEKGVLLLFYTCPGYFEYCT